MGREVWNYGSNFKNFMAETINNLSVKQQNGVAERLAPHFEVLVVFEYLVLARIIKTSVLLFRLLKTLRVQEDHDN